MSVTYDVMRSRRANTRPGGRGKGSWSLRQTYVTHRRRHIIAIQKSFTSNCAKTLLPKLSQFWEDGTKLLIAFYCATHSKQLLLVPAAMHNAQCTNPGGRKKISNPAGQSCAYFSSGNRSYPWLSRNRLLSARSR